MLVLLMRAICELSSWDYTRGQNICTKFRDDRFRYSSNIKVITSTILKASVLVLLIGEFVTYTTEVASLSMIYQVL
jgi:hypothetical protein